MISPFLSYVKAAIEQDVEEYAYRVYMTDAAQLTPQSKYLTVRWAELVDRKPVDERSGDEIAADIIARAGLKPKGGEEQ